MQHSSYMPHGICYLWQPELVWLHVISDSVTALAYYAIPPALLFLVVRARREARALGPPYPARGLPYEGIYLAFGLFIVACGTTHVMNVWNVWSPTYWISGTVKAVTALASVATAIALPPLMPRVIALFRQARISELQHTQLSHLAAIVQHSDDAIISQEFDATILTWNGGAERLYGYTAEEAIGRPIDLIVPPDRRDEMRALLRRVAAGESVTRHETVRRRRDGSLIDISLHLGPIRRADGSIVAVSAMGHDITMRKRERDRELRLAQEQAARAEAERLAERYAAVAAEQKRLYEEANAINRTKSEFLAVMSHELRTPLNAIMGYADLLDAGVHGEMVDVQREQLQRIRRSAHHLTRLIEQILEHAKLEAGKAKPEWTRVDLRNLVGQALQLVEPAAAGKRIVLHCDVEPGVEIETDATYLRQVLLNLFSNAVKFTDSGSVSVSAVVDDAAIDIRVTDTGTGIAPEHLEAVFEAFWQADQGRTRSAEGTGLGLTVARRLAQVLGGSLTASSEPGRGTTMTLRLPR